MQKVDDGDEICDWATYRLEKYNTHFHIRNEVLESVETGYSCVYRGIELIGKPYYVVKRMFGTSLEKARKYSYEEEQREMYVNDNLGVTIWVTNGIVDSILVNGTSLYED